MKLAVLILTVLTTLSSYAQDAQVQPVSQDPQQSSQFQSRKQGFLFSAKSFKSIYDSGATTESNEYGLTYLFNFGHAEIGPIIGIVSSEVKNGSSHEYSYALSYGAQALFNLIANKPNQEWVPFLGVSLESANATAISDSNTVNGTGFGNAFSVGVKHFPVGNNVAMYGAYQTGSLALTMGNSNVKVNTSGLVFGIAAYY